MQCIKLGHLFNLNEFNLAIKSPINHSSDIHRFSRYQLELLSAKVEDLFFLFVFFLRPWWLKQIHARVVPDAEFIPAHHRWSRKRQSAAASIDCILNVRFRSEVIYFFFFHLIKMAVCNTFTPCQSCTVYKLRLRS